MSRDVLSEEEFNSKESYMGNEVKRNEIMKIIKVNEYISMKEISKRSKVKWVYSEVIRLLKEKKIMRGKKGIIVLSSLRSELEGERLGLEMDRKEMNRNIIEYLVLVINELKE